ncbi:MAG TPA: isoprenylcysteine carboxylmethyltransferase family protein [Anaerolineales bacterium]|nr:isoprenylcysteine carboxylmethyltransferase family protein [Anaerolineales bacterium]
MISSVVYPSIVYTLVFTAGFWCWIFFEVWVFLRERGTARDSSRDRGSTFFVILILAVGMTLGLNFPHMAPQFNLLSFFPAFFVLGIALVVGGLLFRFWAIQTLGKFFRTRVMIQDEHRLITSGPYKYLRNPSYTALLLILPGFGFGIGNWLSALVLFVAGVIAYAWRIAIVEEPALAKQFGEEFQAYKKKTWALIPFIW